MAAFDLKRMIAPRWRRLALWLAVAAMIAGLFSPFGPLVLTEDPATHFHHEPDETLADLTSAVLRWTDGGDLGDGWGLLDVWVQEVPTGTARDTLCDAIAWRFAGAHTVTSCGEGR